MKPVDTFMRINGDSYYICHNENKPHISPQKRLYIEAMSVDDAALMYGDPNVDECSKDEDNICSDALDRS